MKINISLRLRASSQSGLVNADGRGQREARKILGEIILQRHGVRKSFAKSLRQLAYELRTSCRGADEQTYERRISASTYNALLPNWRINTYQIWRPIVSLFHSTLASKTYWKISLMSNYHNIWFFMENNFKQCEFKEVDISDRDIYIRDFCWCACSSAQRWYILNKTIYYYIL